MAALFVAALWTLLQTDSISPYLWGDTDIEEMSIDTCLDQGACTMVGYGATVGIFHSAGYLHVRTLLRWLGMSNESTHVLLLTATAFGVVLVAFVARRLDSRTSAALAAVLMMVFAGIRMQLEVLTDVTPLAFLSAAFLFIAFVATARSDARVLAALGAVGGVMANCYSTSVLLGASVVWIALLRPERRRARVGITAGTFAVTMFVVAPGTWLTNARLVLGHRVTGNGQAMVVRGLTDLWVADVLLFAGLAWVASAIFRPTLRRRLDVPAAIFLPIVPPLLAGMALGVLNPQEKYLAHIVGAISAGAAIAIVAVARALMRRVSALAQIPRLSLIGDRLVERWTPWMAAAFIATGGASWGYPRASMLTNRELDAVVRILSEHGWSGSRIARDLKQKDDGTRYALWRRVHTRLADTSSADLERAYLLKVPLSAVPSTLPPNVSEAGVMSEEATLLAFSCSWIDWSSFRACTTEPGGVEQCVPSGLPAGDMQPDSTPNVPGLPQSNYAQQAPRRVTLRFPLKPTDRCPAEEIYMPRLNTVCAGEIVEATGVASEIDAGGRSARLTRAPGGGSPELVVGWNVGGQGCRAEYRGYPPFFVEGDPASVELLRGILERAGP